MRVDKKAGQARTHVTFLANAGETEGLWVVLTGSGEESSATLDVRTQAGLAGLSQRGVTMVTLLTPEWAGQIFILSMIHPHIHPSIHAHLQV